MGDPVTRSPIPPLIRTPTFPLPRSLPFERSEIEYQEIPMRLTTLLPLALVAAGALCSAGRAGEWVRLYNGKDLTGWHAEGGELSAWQAKGEIVTCYTKKTCYLATDKQYGDFELRLDYKLPLGGNSGLGLRFAPGTWPSTEGMELQLLDDPAPQYVNLPKVQRNGALYMHVAPKATPGKPAGEWNHIEVKCQGPRVSAKMNGVDILDFSLDDYLDHVGKGKIGLGKRPRKGLVGLQSHGDPVEFRNVEIREL